MRRQHSGNAPALTSVFRPLDFALARWAERKNKKRLKGHPWRAWRWLHAVMRREPSLFSHWALLRDNNGRTIGAV